MWTKFKLLVMISFMTVIALMPMDRWRILTGALSIPSASFGVWARRDHNELTAGRGCSSCRFFKQPTHPHRATSVPRGGGRVRIWDTNPALFGTTHTCLALVHSRTCIQSWRHGLRGMTMRGPSSRLDLIREKSFRIFPQRSWGNGTLCWRSYYVVK